MDLKARNEEMRDFFNRKADGYDDVHGSMMDNKRSILHHLPEHVSQVLDLGAGTGLELVALFERYPEAHVRVIDISSAMLEQLKNRPFAERLDIVCGDFFAEDLGCGYDAVISSAALHHFDEAEKLLLYRRIWDSLKPGGMFVNSDRCSATPEEEERDFAEYAQDPHRWPHMDTPMTAEHEMQILHQVGFVSVGHEVLPDPRYQTTFGRKPI